MAITGLRILGYEGQVTVSLSTPLHIPWVMPQFQPDPLSIFCRLQTKLALFSQTLTDALWATEFALPSGARASKMAVPEEGSPSQLRSLEPIAPFGLLLSPPFSVLIVPGSEAGVELWFEGDRILAFVADLQHRYRNYSRIKKLQGHAINQPFHNVALAQQQFSQLLIQTYTEYYSEFPVGHDTSPMEAISGVALKTAIGLPPHLRGLVDGGGVPNPDELRTGPDPGVPIGPAARKQTEDLEEALIAAQAADQAKVEFLATMSHELRTPLTSVIGMSATLLRWSFGPLNSRQRDYLQVIHDSGEHLLGLINDILELSEIEAGQGQLTIANFSLTRTVQYCIDLFQDQARSANIALQSNIALTREQDLFSADLRRVRQILINLLDNALKFTNPSGTVVLRIWREENWAVFQVEDTGIGFNDGQKAQLFQRFRQLEGSHHRQHNGLGVGLTLTKRFVDLHQGRIEIDSAPNQGSIFTVWLPGQLPSQPPSKSSPKHPLQGQIVLLEDEEETALLICELLTAAAYQVVWLVEGSTALKQVQQLNPIGIILNIDLAASSALELLEHLRQANRSTKVIALVSSDRAIDSSWVDATLPKPFQPEQLLTTLTSLLTVTPLDAADPTYT